MRALSCLCLIAWYLGGGALSPSLADCSSSPLENLPSSLMEEQSTPLLFMPLFVEGETLQIARTPLTVGQYYQSPSSLLEKRATRELSDQKLSPSSPAELNKEKVLHYLYWYNQAFSTDATHEYTLPTAKELQEAFDQGLIEAFSRCEFIQDSSNRNIISLFFYDPTSWNPQTKEGSMRLLWRSSASTSSRNTLRNVPAPNLSPSQLEDQATLAALEPPHEKKGNHHQSASEKNIFVIVKIGTAILLVLGIVILGVFF